LPPPIAQTHVTDMDPAVPPESVLVSTTGVWEERPEEIVPTVCAHTNSPGSIHQLLLD